ncbi:MAG: dienelactone hydrolase family protein [Ignavibacteria bacterium]|nr:dienelactone hydrolase family protein [Ignavibacteria bacterium]
MKKLSVIIAVLILTSVCSCSETNKQKTDLVEQEVLYSSDSTNLNGFLVYDNNIKEKRPGVLIVHEWWGLNDYARSRARMLAELGYTAFALDMFGNGKTATHPEDAQKFASAIFSNIESGEKRFMAAYNFLEEQATVDPNNIAAIGYCFGGGVVLHMASIGTDLKAVASFHGSLQAIVPPEEGVVKAFILVCNGADDPFTTPEQIVAFKKEMDSAKVNYEFINYEGAVHSFTSPYADSLGKMFNMPLAYDEKADKESWAEMKKVFTQVFSK